MPYHYYDINVRITIADRIQFSVIKSITIESSIEKLSDTAKLELPREFKNAKLDENGLSLERKNLLEYMKVGDRILIEAGYNGNLFTEFEGYLTEIGAEIPTELECEDEMYKLRRAGMLNKTFKSVDLKTLLKFIAPGYEIEALDMSLGKMQIERATPYKVIEKLKSDYGIRCFFKGKKLYAGMLVDFKPQTVHQFNFKRNIRSSSDLKYKTKEGRQLFIKAVSMQKGGANKKVTYDFGTPGESEVSLHAPVNLNQAQLKDWVEKYWNSKIFDGLEGSVDGWAIPRTEVGDSAQITDPNYPTGYRDGQYFIEGVTTTIDESSGFKRQNKLSFKIKSKNETTIFPNYGHITITPRVQKRKKTKSGTSSTTS